MPITSFTIGGVEVDPLMDGFEIRGANGAVSTLVCDIESYGSPVLRWPLMADVIVEEEGVRIFGGRLTQTHERGHGGPNLRDPLTDAPDVIVSLTAEDYTSIADRVTVTLTIAEGTLLKAGMQALIGAALGAVGVTLDAAQVNGPALPAMSFVRKRASEVIQKFMDATNYLSRIDYEKKWRMGAPGYVVAPFDIDEFDDPAKWTGDVEVEQILGDDYANRVIVTGAPFTVEGFVESWTGDGSTVTFVLSHPLVADRGFVALGASYSGVTTGAKAWAFYNGTSNVSDGQTVTIDGVTYTFESVNTNTAYRIPIGSTWLQTKQRLVAAIMASGTPGTDYGAGTSAHPTVEADIPSTMGGGPNVLDVVAAHYRTVGAAGNGTLVSATTTAFWYWEGNTRPGILDGGYDAGPYTGYTVTNETLNHIGDSSTASWAYDPATNSITRVVGAPASGDAISLIYDHSAQAVGSAEDAAAIAFVGLYEWVEENRPEIRDDAAANTLAAQLLADKLAAGDQTAIYVTRYAAPGLLAGQTQVISAPSRDLSGDYVLTEVVVRGEVTEAGKTTIRTVTAKRSQPNRGRWQSTYGDWLDTGGAAAAPAAVGTGGAATTNPALPDKAVQFNDSGSFGGSPQFTYDKTTHCLVMGLSSDITAESPESCVVMGDDCHIADP